MPKALIMFIPAAQQAAANAAFENVGLGPDTLSIRYTPTAEPENITHYACHWAELPSVETENLMLSMLAGNMPTEYEDEFGRPQTAEWIDPSEAASVAAMAAITSDFVTYPDPMAYDPSAQMEALATAQGLTLYQEPEIGEV